MQMRTPCIVLMISLLCMAPVAALPVAVIGTVNYVPPSIENVTVDDIYMFDNSTEVTFHVDKPNGDAPITSINVTRGANGYSHPQAPLRDGDNYSLIIYEDTAGEYTYKINVYDCQPIEIETLNQPSANPGTELTIRQRVINNHGPDELNVTDIELVSITDAGEVTVVPEFFRFTLEDGSSVPLGDSINVSISIGIPYGTQDGPLNIELDYKGLDAQDED